jgi:predicted transcriptional regulator
MLLITTASEIAEAMGITRQGARDMLRRRARALANGMYVLQMKLTKEIAIALLIETLKVEENSNGKEEDEA